MWDVHNHQIVYYIIYFIGSVRARVACVGACLGNKKCIHLKKSKENSDVTVVLCRYVTDGNGIESCIKIRNGVASAKQGLDSSLEEADCRIILLQ